MRADDGFGFGSVVLLAGNFWRIRGAVGVRINGAGIFAGIIFGGLHRFGHGGDGIDFDEHQRRLALRGRLRQGDDHGR